MADDPPNRGSRATSPPNRASKRFPRDRRIRRRADFVRIQDGGIRVSSDHLLFLLALRNDSEPARIGIVASKKIGNAVARNRAKRLIREAFRRCERALPAGLDVVIVARPGTNELDYGVVAAEFSSAVPRVARRAATLAHR